MALTNSQYDAIMREYEDRQSRNRHLLEERKAYIFEHVEGYRELSDSVASLSVTQGKKLLTGDDSALKDLRDAISRLISKNSSFLPKQDTLPIIFPASTAARTVGIQVI